MDIDKEAEQYIKISLLKKNKPYRTLFNLINMGYCKGLSYITLHFTFNIPEDELDYMPYLERNKQHNFRCDVVRKFKKCVITGLHLSECDACHIIPYSESKNNTINNGLLLHKGLHSSFDNYFWSINPDTFCIEVKSDLNIMIQSFRGQKLPLNDEMKSYLTHHYKIFNNLK